MKEPIKDADMPNDKFIVAIISTENSVRDLFTSALEDHPQVEALWTLSEYPAPSDLARINDTPNGCVVYLDFGDALRARAIAAELDRKYQKAGTIAVHTNERGTDLRDLMQLGVRELITAPFDRVEIQRAFERARPEAQENHRSGRRDGLDLRVLTGAARKRRHYDRPAQRGCGRALGR